jgi:hypothetical protein
LRLRAIAICLGAGAVISVAVAWACALGFDPDRVVGRPLHGAENQGAFSIAELEPLRLLRDQSASDDEIVVCDEVRLGANRRVVYVDPYWRAAIDSVHEVGFDTTLVAPLCVRVSAGWPWTALVGERRIAGVRPTSGETVFDNDWMFGVRLPGDVLARDLPLEPMPVGFALNALVFAAVVWLLLLAPFATRRMLRRRRGLCERCGYPRGESARCSECGETLA